MIEEGLTGSIVGRRNEVSDGEIDWTITLGASETTDDYRGVLPALSLPYGWFTADESPDELRNGFELSRGGRFNSTVVVRYPSGDVLTVEHTSEGFRASQPRLLEFTVRVSGSSPPSIDLGSSSLLPVSLILAESSPGQVEGFGPTQEPGVNVSLHVAYSAIDGAIARPVLNLSLEHTPVEIGGAGRVITFTSQARLNLAAVREVNGSVGGSVGGSDLPRTELVARVDPTVDGRLHWSIRVARGIDVASYLPLLPALVAPAGWFTASENPEDEVRNGVDSSGGGAFNASVSLRFASGEILLVEIASRGLGVEEAGIVEYRVFVSGSHPEGFDSYSLLPLSIGLQEISIGEIRGESVLADQVRFSLSISYVSVGLESLRPGVVFELDLTDAEISGLNLEFTSDAALLLGLQFRGVLSEELVGSIEGRAVTNGEIDWTITLGASETTDDYRGVLPALSLPYGWFTADESPDELRNGFELSRGGRFNSTVVVRYPSGDVLTVEHTSEGFRASQPRLLEFTVRVSGSSPPGIDLGSSSLLPVSLILAESSPGQVEGFGPTQEPGVNISLHVAYSAIDGAIARPVLNLSLEHTPVEIGGAGRVITFTSQAGLNLAAVREVNGSVGGSVGGSDLPRTELVARVDPTVDGRLHWSIRVARGIDVASYLPLLPALVAPAGWFTASENPEDEVRNGVDSSGGGAFNASVSLRFASGEILLVEIASRGLGVEEAGIVEYRVFVSGSHPEGFDSYSLLPLSIGLQEISIGEIRGESVLADQVRFSLSISYVSVGLESLRPGVVFELDLTDAEISGLNLEFTSDAALLLGLQFRGVLSEELVGSIEGRAVTNGEIDWTITLGASETTDDYRGVLPALSLPYGWFTADESPDELRNGFELSRGGRFNSTVVVRYPSGDVLTVEHTSEGFRASQPRLLEFTVRVSGSSPPGIDLGSSSLLPVSLILAESSPGQVEGFGPTQEPGVNISLHVAYSAIDGAIARPVLNLSLEHTPVEIGGAGRVITFTSQAGLNLAAVREVNGSVGGSVGGSDLPRTELVARVDPTVDGRLHWSIRVARGIDVASYLPLLPALVAPAGWFTASENPEDEVRNGVDSSGGGAFNASVSLRFASGEILLVEIASRGLGVEEAGVVEYRVFVSGSHPEGFDSYSLLPLSVGLQETSIGEIRGEFVLADQVRFSLSISYVSVGLESLRPGVVFELDLTDAEISGLNLEFTSDAALLLGLQFQGVLSEELVGSIEGRAVTNGEIDWTITLGASETTDDYRGVLPALSLPYGWFTADESPDELRNGFELSRGGRFNSTVVVRYPSGDVLTVEHTSEGFRASQPRLLEFTVRVSGSSPPGIDLGSSSLLPVSLILAEPSPGQVEGFGPTQEPGVNVSLHVAYSAIDGAIARPVLNLSLEHTPVDIGGAGRVITFTSQARLNLAAVREVSGSVGGSVGGSDLPRTELVARVDPTVDGRLHWSIRVARGIDVASYLPLLPALVAPAGWFTASENPEDEVRNGVDSSGGGAFNASVSLRFASGEILLVEIASRGLGVEEAGIVEYRVFVSGSHPEGFDSYSLLPLSIGLQETSIGEIRGESIVADQVRFSLSISYVSVGLESLRPGVVFELDLTDAEISGLNLEFTSDAALLLGLQFRGVLSEELVGSIEGRAVTNGEIDWTITLGASETTDDYRGVLPALSLPYGWFTADESPDELRNGFELSRGGRFNSTVVVRYPSGDVLTVEHTSEGFRASESRLLEFTVRVSGSSPPGIDLGSSSLLPVSLILAEPSPGQVEGFGLTQEPGVNVSLHVAYSAIDGAIARPVLNLSLEHTPVEIGAAGRVITFTSQAGLNLAAVREVSGSVGGSVGGSDLPQTEIVARVDPTVDGRLHWSIRVARGIDVASYLPLLPALVAPAGWFTASENPEDEVRNGVDSSGGGAFNASVSLRFASGEILLVEIASRGLGVEEAGIVEYRVFVSGSHPEGFDSYSLLPLSVGLQETSIGEIRGESVLADQVRFSLSISYVSVGLESLRPGVVFELDLMDAEISGLNLEFTSDAALLLGLQFRGVLSEELVGSIEGRAVTNGEIDWTITLGASETTDDYRGVLPALSLPYGWFTADESPDELRNGFELSRGGRFNSTVVVRYPSGDVLTVEHTSEGFRASQPRLLEFTVRVSGSSPPGIDLGSSSLLPVSLILAEPSPGQVEGFGPTQEPGVNVSLHVAYSAIDGAIARPVLNLSLEHTPVEIGAAGRVITFTSQAGLNLAAVREVSGSVGGSVGGSDLPQTEIVARVDPTVDGRLHWSIRVARGIDVASYLPLLPALVAPAGWFTASENPEDEVRNGVDSSGGGAFNASVSLRFASGEILLVEIASRGLGVEEAGVVEYRVFVSGSHPEGFDSYSLLPLSVGLQETSIGEIRGESVLADQVRFSLSISYVSVGLESLRPGVVFELDLTDAEISGLNLEFTSDAALLLGLQFQGVLSEELVGSIEGRAVTNGEIDWTITLGASETTDDYRGVLPALSLPYGWFTADESPDELRNGFELSRGGRFNSTVVVRYPSGDVLTVEHTSEGFRASQPRLLEFTVRVSGSSPPGIDLGSSSLLPVLLILAEPSPGQVEGFGPTQEPGVNVSLHVAYSAIDGAIARPVLNLSLEHTPVGIGGSGRVITFTSQAGLNLAAVREVTGSVGGSVGGSDLPRAEIVARVDPTVDGRLHWSIRVASGIDVASYLPLLPALVAPAGWFTATENPEDEVRNGVDSSGGGAFNASVSLRFASGEILLVEIASRGLGVEEAGVVEYRVFVSGSHPEGFDSYSLLPLSVGLQETSIGEIRGESVLADQVRFSLSISYVSVGLESLRPGVVFELDLTDAEISGLNLEFTSDAALLLGLQFQGVLSEELVGSIEGRAVTNGEIDWTITLGASETTDDYRGVLPALSLPYGWFTADESPDELRNGFELSRGGRFNSTVVVRYPSGDILTVEHVSEGFRASQPRLLEFTVRVSGSSPPGIDLGSSSLLPVSLILAEPSPGQVEGFGPTQEPGVNVSLHVAYSAIDGAIARPVLNLSLEHTPVGIGGSGRVITFTSQARLNLAAVREVAGSVGGSVGGSDLPRAEIVARVDPTVDGRLHWSIRVARGIDVASYLPLLPALVAPAGWFTASENPEDEVRNGVDSSGGGAFNASVSLRFASGEILLVEIASRGLGVEEAGIVEYRVFVSGSHPEGFDSYSLLPLSVGLQETSIGEIRGESVVADQVRFSLSISYVSVSLESLRPGVVFELDLTDAEISGLNLEFTSDAALLLGLQFQGVLSEELVGSIEGRAVTNGEIDWTITLGASETTADYRGVLPALSLPYGWFTADESPDELRNGFELSRGGRFNSTVVVRYPSGDVLTVEHTSEGFRASQPRLLEFTVRVSGSSPPGIDLGSSSLLPVSLILAESSPGQVEGFGPTQEPGVNISLHIVYSPVDTTVARPMVKLTFSFIQIIVGSNGRSILFISRSTLVIFSIIPTTSDFDVGTSATVSPSGTYNKDMLLHWCICV